MRLNGPYCTGKDDHDGRSGTREDFATAARLAR